MVRENAESKGRPGWAMLIKEVIFSQPQPMHPELPMVHLLVIFISKGFRFSKSTRGVSQSLQLYEETLLISSISCSWARPNQLCEVELLKSILNQVCTKNNQGIYHLRVFHGVRQGNVTVKYTEE